LHPFDQRGALYGTRSLCGHGLKKMEVVFDELAVLLVQDFGNTNDLVCNRSDRGT